jgi:hypothetical protein
VRASYESTSKLASERKMVSRDNNLAQYIVFSTPPYDNLAHC